MSSIRTRLVDESGFAGGAEALPFGVLVFVIGGLLLANAWGVIDAKLAAYSAAREATRAYVESPIPDYAIQNAQQAAGEAIAGHGRDPSKMRLKIVNDANYTRCSPVTFEVSYPVSTISLPWVKGLGAGSITVRAGHSELVDPYRNGVPVQDGSETSCP